MVMKGWAEAQNYAGGIIKYLFDKVTALDNASSGDETDIAALEEVVGDEDSGLVKSVNGLTTTVGDANGGLVKSVADINTAIGDESTEGTILARIKALEDAP